MNTDDRKPSKSRKEDSAKCDVLCILRQLSEAIMHG